MVLADLATDRVNVDDRVELRRLRDIKYLSSICLRKQTREPVLLTRLTPIQD